MKQETTHNDLKSVLKRVRKYEIRLRKVVSGSVAGEIKSLTKGSGLEFDDVRPYQYGDDVRAIDWKVTAKGEGTYIKTFKEEKDQTVWVLFDVSGSTLLGKKELLVKELAGLIYLSAINQGSNLGLMAFSDKVEWVVKPSKSKVKAMGQVNQILRFSGQNKKTDLAAVIGKLQSIEKRKSLVFLISDFLDNNYQDAVSRLSRKHEVILINVEDKESSQLENLPMGIMPVVNAESSKMSFSLKFPWFNKLLGNSKEENKKEALEVLDKNKQVDVFTLFTGDNYVDDLAIFLKNRNRR